MGTWLTSAQGLGYGCHHIFILGTELFFITGHLTLVLSPPSCDSEILLQPLCVLSRIQHQRIHGYSLISDPLHPTQCYQLSSWASSRHATVQLWDLAHFSRLNPGSKLLCVHRSPNILGHGSIHTSPSPNFVPTGLMPRVPSWRLSSTSLVWPVSFPSPLLPNPCLLTRILITYGNGMA